MQCLIIKALEYNIIYTYLKKGSDFDMTEKTTLTIRIDKDLLKEMKILAIRQDTSVTQIIVSYLEELVEENKK